MAGRSWQASDALALLDEHPDAYKPIDQVMRDQADLVEIEHELEALANYKGVERIRERKRKREAANGEQSAPEGATVRVTGASRPRRARLRRHRPRRRRPRRGRRPPIGRPR